MISTARGTAFSQVLSPPSGRLCFLVCGCLFDYKFDEWNAFDGENCRPGTKASGPLFLHVTTWKLLFPFAWPSQLCCASPFVFSTHFWFALLTSLFLAYVRVVILCVCLCHLQLSSLPPPCNVVLMVCCFTTVILCARMLCIYASAIVIFWFQLRHAQFDLVAYCLLDCVIDCFLLYLYALFIFLLVPFLPMKIYYGFVA